MKIIASLLLLAVLVAADDAATLVDQLFDRDAAKRVAARKRLLAMEDGVLAKVLKRIEARQVKAAAVLQIYSVRDLMDDKVFWPVTRESLRAFEAVIREDQNGVLVVLATKDVHAKVAERLAALRKRLSSVVTISSAIVQLGEGMEIPRGFGKGEFAKWIEKNKVVVRALPRLTCRNGQRVEVTALRSVSYIADFDVEIACEPSIAYPVLATLPRGFALHVRAIAGEKVDLHIDVQTAELQDPIGEAKLDLPVGEAVRIQVPESRSVHIRTSRRVEPGASTVVDLGEHRFIVVTAETAQLPD